MSGERPQSQEGNRSTKVAPGYAGVRRFARWMPSAIALVFLSLPALALADPAYAPLDQPGPPLSVPLVQLRAALRCEPSVRNATVEPVLLNPATGVTAEQNYSWNWEPALDKLGIPWCAYTAPHSTLDNIETSGEYLVYAIRTMHALARRRIAIMGHSQGGMSMRWPLRFWPDTRAMVDDVIGFSGTNHGTTVMPVGGCGPGCPPGVWQQFAGSGLIAALNSRAESFAGISYTELYTHTDEVVHPNSGLNASAALHTGGGAIANFATQELCPLDLYEHLTIGTIDPVAYALAVDALTHPGPADPRRIPTFVCSQILMPGVNALVLNTELQVLAALPGATSVAVGPLAGAISGAPLVYAEPPLACYVFATCAGSAAPTLRIWSIAVRRRPRGSATVHVLVSTPEGNALEPVPNVTVTLAGHRVHTDDDGDAVLRVAMVRNRSYRLSAARSGCNPATITIRSPR